MHGACATSGARPAGPCHDGLEIELLAAGLLERMPSPSGHETVRRCIAAPDEVPPECGVLVIEHGRLVLGRAAPRRGRAGLPFGVWMALAKATPVPGLDDGVQAMLGLAA